MMVRGKFQKLGALDGRGPEEKLGTRGAGSRPPGDLYRERVPADVGRAPELCDRMAGNVSSVCVSLSRKGVRV